MLKIMGPKKSKIAEIKLSLGIVTGKEKKAKAALGKAKKKQAKILKKAKKIGAKIKKLSVKVAKDQQELGPKATLK